MTDTAATAPSPDRLVRTILTAAWMAILLGLLVQGAVLAAKLGAGGKVPGAQIFVDFAGGITWAVIVCGAVAIGTAAGRNVTAAMGILGLIGAPLAFAAMKALQRGLADIVDQPPEALTNLMFQTGGVKALEYGLLGAVLGMMVHTPRSTWRNHLLIGLGFGVLFAGVFIWLIFANSPPGATPPTPRLAGTAANELIFPTGCSMVLYWVSQISARVVRS